MAVNYVGNHRHGFQGPFISAPQKGTAERGHVQETLISSRSVKNVFDTFRQFSRMAKNQKSSKRVKHIFDILSTVFAQDRFSGLFLGALSSANCKTVSYSRKFPVRILREFAAITVAEPDCFDFALC